MMVGSPFNNAINIIQKSLMLNDVLVLRFYFISLLVVDVNFDHELYSFENVSIMDG